MSLTQCQQCWGAFDDSKQFCPGCGFPAPVQVEDELPQETSAELAVPIADSLQQETGNANSLLVAVVIFMAMVLFGLRWNGADSSRRATEADAGKSWAITMAQAFVKEHLKSPTTASFPWSYDEYRVTRDIGREWSVSGYVDATNTFNAKLRKHWSVRMRDDGKKWHLLSIDFQ